MENTVHNKQVLAQIRRMEALIRKYKRMIDRENRQIDRYRGYPNAFERALIHERTRDRAIEQKAMAEAKIEAYKNLLT